ncbi:MFS transporter [Acerihabitans sp.]|uniref:MFS transporter n=1 Tax=Acerihabitans sp. TaxID=2811394 RepID=UPI002EDA5FFE
MARTNYRWVICALLFFGTTINYLDRQVLSLLQPSLAKEFSWSNSDYANIAAVFQFTYAIGMIFAGRFVDFTGTKKGYAWVLGIWSLGAILHAFVAQIGGGISAMLSSLSITVPISIAGFMFARLVLGLGESGNFPCAIKATAEWFPKKERSFATGIFNSGANVGAILAPLIVPWMAVQWGWQSTFAIVGVIGFIVLFFWKRLFDLPSKLFAKGKLNQVEYNHITEDVDSQQNRENEHEKISWFSLLAYRQTWAFAIGKFLTDGVWWFFMFWLPAYLSAQYKMSGTQLMLPIATIYCMTMVGSIGGGWLPAMFMKTGLNPYVARMRAMLFIAIFPLAAIFAQPLGHTGFWMPVILIGIAASAHQAWSANLFTTVSDMFPNKAVASVIGIGGMAGGFGGVAVTKVAGALFDHYQALGQIDVGYGIMFVFCGLAYLIAWALMKTLVPRFKVIQFN